MLCLLLNFLWIPLESFTLWWAISINREWRKFSLKEWCIEASMKFTNLSKLVESFKIDYILFVIKYSVCISFKIGFSCSYADVAFNLQGSCYGLCLVHIIFLCWPMISVFTWWNQCLLYSVSCTIRREKDTLYGALIRSS